MIIASRNIVLIKSYFYTMKRSLYLLFALLHAGFATSQDNKGIEIWDFEKLELYIQESTGKMKIINFWATWCGPCIKELPLFENIKQDYEKDAEVLLVSLDFSDMLESRVIPFVEKQGLSAKVILLSDEDYNSWIDKVHPSWSGSIPATLFVRIDGQRIFFEDEFEEEELSNLIDELLNKTQ